MYKLLQLIAVVAAITGMVACGSKDQNKVLLEKKTSLEKLKEQQTKLSKEISDLEAVIAKLDTSAGKSEKAKLVSIAPIKEESFTHYIDLQGKVESENVSMVTPRGGPGQVKALFVKRGDVVKAGQTLLKLDDAILKQSLQTAQQNLETLKTQLAFTKNIYQKQKNLWDQNIGTEVQYISAKNNYETVENQLKTAQEQVKINKEQLSFTNVTAEISGVLEDVNVKVGEMFMGTNQIRIVNTEHLKITTQVPENYLNKVAVGTPVKVSLPDINKTIDATISVSGKLIDPLSRSFFTEAKIPADKDFHPNQVAIVKIRDYVVAKAIVVPLNTIQSDEKGKYIMVASKEGTKLVARKRVVVIGQLYGDNLEIKSGLQIGDNIVTEGYQSLYEGQAIATEIK
ncbi:MAG: efflux RND transporter periplasmic adaptor subunit [Bacteroidota bacterium]